MESCNSKNNLKLYSFPNPAMSNHIHSSQVKKEKPFGEERRIEKWVRKFDGEDISSPDPFADSESRGVKKEEKMEEGVQCVNSNTNDPNATNKGDAGKVTAKRQLHEVCAAYLWKAPIFECCKEEGMGHSKLFTFKVVIEIDDARDHITILECFGVARPQKKAAAENAAEGALWYLKQLCYFPINKLRRLDIKFVTRNKAKHKNTMSGITQDQNDYLS